MDRPVRARDGQQWIYDWILKTTGRAIHFEMDGRQVPAQAKSVRMVAKHLRREATQAETLAHAAEERGDGVSARILYRTASEKYREAQHFAIPAITEERWQDYARCRDCAERGYALSNYPIERVEIPFGDTSVPGILHRVETDTPAPAIVFIPGMDNTKENYPNPLANEFHARGMHVLAIDGPGQGEALERGIHVTADNHVIAATGALELLAARDDVDAGKIGIAGRSFGTYWTMRAAAAEPRFAAVGGAVANYFWDRITIFDEAPIRFKQVFMAMAGMDDEAAFDAMCEDFTLKGRAQQVRCPVLMATGEFDPLCPIEDTYAVFDALAGPKELWVLEDEFHPIITTSNLSGTNTFHFVADWMRRALHGEIPEGHQRRVLIKKNGDGLFDA